MVVLSSENTSDEIEEIEQFVVKKRKKVSSSLIVKHEPLKVEELAVNRKKVDEVKQWLMNFSGTPAVFLFLFRFCC